MNQSLIETMLQRIGSSKVPTFARENFGYRATVLESGEFRRIEALPRRDWLKEIEQYTAPLVNMLKTPEGTMTLRPIQVGALIDTGLYGGSFLPIGVGEGKALISLLAPVVLDAKRPILFVPAALREQTLEQVIPKMSKHWKLHPNLKVIGYSELSLAKNARMLEELNPDLIVGDEIHYLKRKQAGRTKRMVRYLRENDDVKFVGMSGTISNRSLKDWAHIAEWCLGPYAPIPLRWQELCEWADALDEGVPDESRVAPGALLNFCNEGENARQGFRRRLVETPGVVASAENKLGVSLRISAIKDIGLSVEATKAMTKLKNTWETPNGDIITEAVALWRHLREMSLGFFYKWEPAAPREWLEARRNWKSYVRETLKHNRRNLDTELQVWNECKRQNILPEWQKWKAIKDTFKIHTVAEWIDHSVLLACRKWLSDTMSSGEKGILWVEHREFGKKLMHYTGYPYFGAGDSSILTTNNKVIIASIAAHGEGKNLQRFSKNLIVCPPTSGKVFEQTVGRTHRQGQQADEVTVEIFQHTYEFQEAFAKARGDARYLEDTYGNVQKLNYADIIGV